MPARIAGVEPHPVRIEAVMAGCAKSAALPRNEKPMANAISRAGSSLSVVTEAKIADDLHTCRLRMVIYRALLLEEDAGCSSRW